LYNIKDILKIEFYYLIYLCYFKDLVEGEYLAGILNVAGNYILPSASEADLICVHTCASFVRLWRKVYGIF